MQFTEATSVLHNGMISPEDLGIWSDKHIEPFKRIVDLIHSHGALAGIQLAHAGRKGSTYAPWVKSANGGAYASEDDHGWKNVWAPSAIPFANGYATPLEMTADDIVAFKDAWRAGLKRAAKAGFDVVEVHGAVSVGVSSELSGANSSAARLSHHQFPQSPQ